MVVSFEARKIKTKGIWNEKQSERIKATNAEMIKEEDRKRVRNKSITKMKIAGRMKKFGVNLYVNKHCEEEFWKNLN